MGHEHDVGCHPSDTRYCPQAIGERVKLGSVVCLDFDQDVWIARQREDRGDSSFPLEERDDVRAFDSVLVTDKQPGVQPGPSRGRAAANRLACDHAAPFEPGKPIQGSAAGEADPPGQVDDTCPPIARQGSQQCLILIVERQAFLPCRHNAGRHDTFTGARPGKVNYFDRYELQENLPC